MATYNLVQEKNYEKNFIENFDFVYGNLRNAVCVYGVL